LVVLLYFGVIFMFFFLFLWVLVFLCLCVFILFGRLFLLEIVPSIRRIILEIRQCLSFTSIHLLVISNFQPLSSGVQNWLRDISRFVPLTLLQLSFFTALTERIGYFFGSFLTIWLYFCFGFVVVGELSHFPVFFFIPYNPFPICLKIIIIKSLTHTKLLL